MAEPLPVRSVAMRVGLCVITGLGCLLAACTDAGVVGEVSVRPPPDAAATQGTPAASSQPAAPDTGLCAFGLCKLPPLCDSDLALCVFCESDAECADNPPDVFCSTLTATCVECRRHSDCPAHAPFCEGGECGDCEDDDDCEGKLKCHDGVCEPA